MVVQHLLRPIGPVSGVEHKFGDHRSLLGRALRPCIRKRILHRAAFLHQRANVFAQGFVRVVDE
jgi:hypothetical protein